MRRAKWVWRLPECSIIVMRLCSSEQLKMQEPCLFWDPSQIAIVESCRWITDTAAAGRGPPLPLLLPWHHFKRESQVRHRVPNPVINLFLAAPTLEGEKTEDRPVSPAVQPAPLHPPPLLPAAHSRRYLSPAEQSVEQSSVAVWWVKLCGYANVSRLLGVLLNGWAQEVNKRVWMRGGGRWVNEMK